MISLPESYPRKKAQICIALKLICPALRMTRANEGSHRFTWHPHVYLQMEWVIMPLLFSRRASPKFGRYSFSVAQRVGGWVGLGGWLHTDVVCPPEDGHTFQYQRTDSAAAGDRIELTTIESQVRRPNHYRLPSHLVSRRLRVSCTR